MKTILCEKCGEIENREDKYFTSPPHKLDMLWKWKKKYCEKCLRKKMAKGLKMTVDALIKNV